ncbi:hypothetical protein B0H19DRAFT_1265409 [Mycena capillaripes]|nr:hypothetical protein B0H19DRAFT_1265409 [Mycena capillaripes]
MTAGPRQEPRRRSCRAFSASARAFFSLPAPSLYLFVGPEKVSSIPATHFVDAIRFHVSLHVATLQIRLLAFARGDRCVGGTSDVLTATF